MSETASADLRRRGLYRYSDGVGDRQVYGDTLAIQLRMQDACPGRDIGRVDTLLNAMVQPVPAGGDPPADGDLPASISPLEAMAELGPIVGAAFELPPFDRTTGEGLSIQERVVLLTDFYATLGSGDLDDDPAARGDDDPTPEDAPEAENPPIAEAASEA